MFQLIVLILLPFVQLGASYWISISVLCTVLLLASIRYDDRVVAHLFQRIEFYVLLSAILFGFVGFLDLKSTDLAHDILANVRMIAFWFITSLYLRFGTKTLNTSKAFAKYSPAILLISSIGMLVLVLMQFKGGTFIGLPKAFYVQNANTLPDELAFKFGKPRPFGTFGEPSYLGLYCVSMIVAISPLVKHTRTRYLATVTIACLLVSGIMSHSMSFIAATAIVTLAMFSQKLVLKSDSSRMGKMIFWAGVSAVAVLTLLVSIPLALQLNSRLGSIVSGSDASANVRLFGPFLAIVNYLVDHPFGLPFTRFLDVFPNYLLKTGVNSGIETGSQNAALNTCYIFGVYGFFMLVFFLRGAQNRILFLYLVATLNFNGTIFSPDKFVIISSTMILYACFNGLKATGSTQRTVVTRRAKVRHRLPRRGL